MIAIPVKTQKQDTAVSPLFGKSKWFAFVNDKREVEFWENDLQNGRAIANLFLEKGIKQVVFVSMGATPLIQLKNEGIECFYAGDGRVLLSDAITACINKNLLHVNEENMQEFLEKSKLEPKREKKGQALGFGKTDCNESNL